MHSPYLPAPTLLRSFMRVVRRQKTPDFRGLLIGANGSGWLADAVIRRSAVLLRSKITRRLGTDASSGLRFGAKSPRDPCRRPAAVPGLVSGLCLTRLLDRSRPTRYLVIPCASRSPLESTPSETTTCSTRFATPSHRGNWASSSRYASVPPVTVTCSRLAC